MKRTIAGCTFMAAALAAQAAPDWHVLDLNTMKCQKTQANPDKARELGAEIKELADGIFSITIKNMAVFVTDSKDHCEQAKRAFAK